jgi:hypothetical protein
LLAIKLLLAVNLRLAGKPIFAVKASFAVKAFLAVKASLTVKASLAVKASLEVKLFPAVKQFPAVNSLPVTIGDHSPGIIVSPVAVLRLLSLQFPVSIRPVILVFSRSFGDLTTVATQQVSDFQCRSLMLAVTHRLAVTLFMVYQR